MSLSCVTRLLFHSLLSHHHVSLFSLVIFKSSSIKLLIIVHFADCQVAMMPGIKTSETQVKPSFFRFNYVSKIKLST